MRQTTLLILDDEPMIGETLQRIARQVGLDARFATEADTFFGILENLRPEFVTLDLNMPGMDGIQVMEELARRGCGSKIIITSGVDMRVLDAAGRSAREHGLEIFGVLVKPFNAMRVRELFTGLQLPPPIQNLRIESTSPAQTPTAADFVLTPLAIKQALQAHSFTVQYQPKVDVRNCALAGFEALVRWRHPLRGMIPPSEFIPMAEAANLIDEITDQVFEIALKCFGRLCESLALDTDIRDNAAMARRIKLSLNVSARSMGNLSLVEKISALCASSGVTAAQVVLELTETGMMDDPVASLSLATRMRMKGFDLSIDDFGTGYSSMLQLVRLPFSEIKVDKSFVATALQSQESCAVVRSIIALGKSLGLKSTAEGVEDEATLHLLREFDCDLAQGYYIAKPLPEDNLLAWIKQSYSK